MIKLQNYTPAIYYNESRDFQLLGRLFDIVLNSVKTEADLIYNLPFNDNSNDNLLKLLALSLGFKPKKQYNSKYLRAVCSVFLTVLRQKGSIKAVQTLCDALFKAADSDIALDYDFTPGKNNTELNLYIPQEFGDISLIVDVLSYVLPAGMSYNIVRELRFKVEVNTEVHLHDEFKIYSSGDTPNTEGTNYGYSDAAMSMIPTLPIEENLSNPDLLTLNKDALVSALAQDTPGLIFNSVVNSGHHKLAKLLNPTNTVEEGESNEEPTE